MDGMRIGELAALVGVSTRAVRHYHHEGLLPEPRRLPNGYREYRLGDAVALARIRRLGELGLGLDEIRDVLADDAGRELREVLLELDADLEREEQAVRDRRNRLSRLLMDGELHADATVSPEMAGVLRALRVDGSRVAEVDRAVLALIDTRAGPDEREALAKAFQPFTTPEAAAQVRDFYTRLDALADADPDDPRVPVLADDMVAMLPDDMADVAARSLDDPHATHWLDTLADEFSPAQTEAIRLMMARLLERRGKPDVAVEAPRNSMDPSAVHG
jgi:DNA-binding transcriptional MerR regulator